MGAILSLFTGSATIPFFGAIIAAIVLGVGGLYATERIQIAHLNSQITAEKGITASVKSALSDETRLYDDLVAKSAIAAQEATARAAVADQKAAEQSRKDATTISGLQAQLAQEQIAHVQISAKLSQELDRAKAMGNPLSPAVLNYLDELRKYGPATGPAPDRPVTPNH